MIEALGKAGRPAPLYLRSLALEHSPRLQEAVFDTHCFHIGELRIPPLPGVVFSEAGWTAGGEAVRVRFDPAVTSLAEISKEGQRLSCITRIYLPPGAPSRGLKQPAAPMASAKYRLAARSDRHWNLRRHPHFHLPLTPLQRTKLNALLVYNDRREEQLLSPRQLALLRRIEAVRKAKGPGAFESLAPPEDGRNLPAYTKRLEAVLD